MLNITNLQEILLAHGLVIAYRVYTVSGATVAILQLLYIIDKQIRCKEVQAMPSVSPSPYKHEV